MNNPTFTQAFKRKYVVESRYVLKHIKTFNNGKDANWSDFKKIFLINLVQYFQNVVSPNSARTYCALLKSLFNDYSEEVTIPCKEYNDILSLKKVGVLNVALTKDELMRLIDYVPLNIREHCTRNQFVLSCLTGMRHSDVLYLEPNNIQGSEILYLAKKTKTLVKTVSSPIAEQFIKEGMNTELHLADFNNILRSICKEVGIDSEVKVIKSGVSESGEKWNFISSHTARRTFATLTYEHTKDLMLVSKLMGHSNTQMTERYLCCDYSNNKAVQSLFSQFKMEKERV